VPKLAIGEVTVGEDRYWRWNFTPIARKNIIERKIAEMDIIEIETININILIC
jgi:hypothetical protein